MISNVRECWSKIRPKRNERVELERDTPVNTAFCMHKTSNQVCNPETPD